MENKILLTLLFITTYLGAHGQSCNCKTNFDSLVTSVEENYVGYFDKITDNSSFEYNQFKDSLSLKAQSETYYGCYLLLRNYLSFFKDPHLNLLLVNIPPRSNYLDTLRSMFSSLKKVALDTNALKRNYEKGIRDEIEGIWNALSFDFQMAVLKDESGENNRYEGIATKADSVRWFTGQIKMNIEKKGELYRIEYFKNDHLPDTIFGTFQDGILDLGSNYGKWKRLYPKSLGNISSPSFSKAKTPISFKKVSKDICVLKIQDAWVTNKRLVDSIVGANLTTIKETPYLIIDIRGNGGGHIRTFDTVMQLIYSKPYKTDGLIVRASKDNISLYKETLEDPIYADQAASLKRTVQIMEENLGKMVAISHPRSITYEKVMPFPKKVAVIVDRKTGSAAEMFVQYAKQSDKVLIVGTNTKGAFDYTEIVRPRDLPCPYLKFYCPMGTGNHVLFPLIDNVGISPDVRWSGEEIDSKFFLDIMNK